MFNRQVKFGLKIPNRLGKMSENLREDFFDSRCISQTTLAINCQIVLKIKSV